MIKLILCRNPFDIGEREVRDLPADGRTFADLIRTHFGPAADDQDGLVAVRNGEVVEKPEECTPADGDYLAVIPIVGKGGGKGKNVLKIIGIIAVTAMLFGGGGGIGKLGLGKLFGGTMGKQLLLGAVLLLGGTLLSGMNKVPEIDLPNNVGSGWENDPEWERGQPTTFQGKPIPLTYGTVRVQGGQVVSSHVANSGKNQVLNLLLCGGEGPVDYVGDVKINGQDIENFNAVADQATNQTFTEAVNIPETPGTGTPGATRTLANTTAIEAEITFARFGYAIGARWAPATVDFTLQYRLVGASPWTEKTSRVIHGGWTRGPLLIRVDGLAAGNYEARIVASTISTKPTGTVFIHEANFVRVAALTYSTDVSVVTRLGTNDQTAIPGFDITYSDQVVGIELNTADWTEFSTEGNAGSGFVVELTFPQGLCYINDNGDPIKTWVKIYLEWKKDGETVWNSAGTATIEAAEKKAVRHSWACQTPDGSTARFDVRLKIAERYSTASRNIDQCVWSMLSHVVDQDKFTRPGRVLVGITALASDKLNGSLPSVSWIQRRDYVWVWNADADEYQQKLATNPAWAAYDFIHRASLLRNIRTGLDEMVVEGDPASCIDWSAFSNWAAYCDETVAGVPRCRANLYLDAADSKWNQVQKVAQIGRGAVALVGTTWTAIWDGASSPVQLFTVGSILEDSFTGEYLDQADRATAIEASFLNEAKDFQRDTIIVYGEDYDEDDTTQQPTQVFFPGLTDYRRVYREAAYRLRLNKYLRRTISFKTDVEGVACRVGDVVLVQHDIPRWGEGGRLVGVDVTKTVVTLDKSITLAAGTTYEILVRLADDTIVTKTLVTPGGGYTGNQVTVTVPFTTAPAQFDPWALGEQNIAAKPFRVLKITRDDDLRCTIEALEYYPEVYDETVDVPTIDYTTTPATISDLVVNFSWDNNGNGFLDISWRPAPGSYGGAIVLIDAETRHRCGITETSYRHPIGGDKTYLISVYGLQADGTTRGRLDASYAVTAFAIPTPAAVTGTEDTWIGNDGGAVTDFDVAYTLADDMPRFMRKAVVSYQADGAGDYLEVGSTTSTTFRAKAVSATSSIRFKVEVMDRWGNLGPAAYSDVIPIIGKSAPPDDVTTFTGAQDPYGIAFEWDDVTNPDLDHYEVRAGNVWASGIPIYSGRTNRFRFTHIAAGTFPFLVKAVDRSGNYSTNAASTTVSVSPPAAPAITPTAINGGIRIELFHARNIDFDHYVIERRPSGGAAVTVVEDLRAAVWNDTAIATLGYTTSWEYRATAYDRSGVSTAGAWSAGATAKRIESLDLTADQLVGKDIRTTCDAGNGTVSGVVVKPAGIEGWAGACRKTFIDAITGTICAVDGCFSGTVCARAGDVGGWTLANGCLAGTNAYLCSGGVLYLGAANAAVVMSSADACYRLWSGCDAPASAPFRVDKTGALTATNATICGAITATSGTFTGTVCACAGNVGGWTLGNGCITGGNAGLYSAGYLLLGSGNDIARLDAADATHRFAIGHATMACAPFRVTKAGALTATGACISGAITATSGTIGGWLIGSTLLANCCAVLSSCGFLHLGDTGGGLDIIRLDAQDATYRLWAGHTTAASAPFRVTKDGGLTATSATICGTVTACAGAIGGWTVQAGRICGGTTSLCSSGLMEGGGFASGACGWRIDASGNAEFNSATIRGALRSTVFTYQEVNAVGGQLLVATAGIVRTAVTTPGAVGTCFALDVTDPEVGHAYQFSAGEILRVQTWNGSSLVSAWGTVTAVTDCTTFYRYTVRLENGTSQAIPARAAVVSYGSAATGGGVSLVGAGTCSPYIDAFTTGATPWNGYNVQTRLGRLDGISGASGYGLWTNCGNITGGMIRSNVFDASGGSCFDLTCGYLQLGGTNGGVSSCGLKWDGTSLNIYGANTVIDCLRVGQGRGRNCYNTAVGFCALDQTCQVGTSGSTAIGANAMYCYCGSPNTAIGYSAMWAAGSGCFNTAVGYLALANAGSGSCNTALGHNALGSATGSGNIAVGAYAGSTETDGNAFYIGNQNYASRACARAHSLMHGILGANAAAQSLCINAATTVNGTLCVVTSVTSPILCGSTCAEFAKVGIGTSSPSVALHVKAKGDNAGTTMIVGNTGSTSHYAIFNTGSNANDYQTSGGYYVLSLGTYGGYGNGFGSLRTEGKAVLAVTDGFVGIGTDSPLHKLHVVGNIYSCACVCAPVICGTTCITSPIVIGSTCLISSCNFHIKGTVCGCFSATNCNICHPVINTSFMLSKVYIHAIGNSNKQHIFEVLVGRSGTALEIKQVTYNGAFVASPYTGIALGSGDQIGFTISGSNLKINNDANVADNLFVKSHAAYFTD